MITIEQMVEKEVYLRADKIASILILAAGSSGVDYYAEDDDADVETLLGSYDYRSAAYEYAEHHGEAFSEYCTQHEYNLTGTVTPRSMFLDNLHSYYAEEFCEEYEVDPYPVEVMEYYIVSKWLAGELERRGEHVGYIADHYFWARTTCGQSIACDRVIIDIYNNLKKGD